MDKKPLPSKPPKHYQVQIDIYKALRLNQTLAYGSVLVAALAIVFSIQSSNQHVNELLKYTLNNVMKVESNGSVSQMSLVPRAENIENEIKDHVDKWVFRYYDFNFNNIQTKTAQAKYLIAKADYDTLQHQYEEWHKEVRRNKYTQTATLENDSWQITGAQELYHWTVNVLIVVSDGYSEDKYRLTISGELILLGESDFPKNPHGFLIRSYNEVSNVKLTQ